MLICFEIFVVQLFLFGECCSPWWPQTQMEQICVDDLKKKKKDFFPCTSQLLSVVWHRVILLTDRH